MYNWLRGNQSNIPKVEFCDFKRNIAVQLCNPERMSRSASPLTIINPTITPTNEVTPSATTLTSRTLTKMKLNPTVTPTSELIKDHELLWIKKKTQKSDSRRRCFLCMKGELGKNNVKKVKFACNKCKVPFCLECFWISHHHPDYKHYSEELPQKNMNKVDPCISLSSAIESVYGNEKVVDIEGVEEDAVKRVYPVEEELILISNGLHCAEKTISEKKYLRILLRKCMLIILN